MCVGPCLWTPGTRGGLQQWPPGVTGRLWQILYKLLGSDTALPLTMHPRPTSLSGTYTCFYFVSPFGDNCNHLPTSHLEIKSFSLFVIRLFHLNSKGRPSTILYAKLAHYCGQGMLPAMPVNKECCPSSQFYKDQD